MVPNTSVPVDAYEIVTVSTREYSVKTLHDFIQQTLKEGSAGFEREEMLGLNDPKLILSTYGKYAHLQIKLTQAILDEHQAERDRENKKLKY